VTIEGIYCEEHVPADAKPYPFTFQMSWKGITALMDYIDGDRDLEVITTVATLREALAKKSIVYIRSILNGEVRESDSGPLGSGDEEH
jgi:hypothetical protein